MPRTTLDLSPDQYDELQRLATDIGIRQADVMRSALRLFGRVRNALKANGPQAQLSITGPAGEALDSVCLEGIRLL